MAEGDLDVTLADQLEGALGEASESSREVLVDLTGATMLDSRAIGILLAWTERLRRVDGGLEICGASPDVRRLFETIGLDREFRFVASREDVLPG